MYVRNWLHNISISANKNLLFIHKKVIHYTAYVVSLSFYKYQLVNKSIKYYQNNMFHRSMCVNKVMRLLNLYWRTLKWKTKKRISKRNTCKSRFATSTPCSHERWPESMPQKSVSLRHRLGVAATHLTLKPMGADTRAAKTAVCGGVSKLKIAHFRPEYPY